MKQNDFSLQAASITLQVDAHRMNRPLLFDDIALYHFIVKIQSQIQLFDFDILWQVRAAQ